MSRHLIIEVSKFEVRSKYQSVKEWFENEFGTGEIKKTFLFAEPNESKDSYDVHYRLGVGSIVPDRKLVLREIV